MIYIIKLLITGAGIIAGACIAGIMLIITFEVISRYFFGMPTYWALEVSTYLCVAAVSLGSAYTLREGSHVGIEILYQKMSITQKRVAHAVSMVAVLLVGVLLVRFGVSEVLVANRFSDRSLTPLAMPMIYPISLIPIGGVLLCIQALELIFRGSGAAHGAEAPLSDELREVR